MLSLRRLDDLHTLEENKAARLKQPIERRVFPKGKDGRGKDGGRAYEEFRWRKFKHAAPAETPRHIIRLMVEMIQPQSKPSLLG